MLAVKAHLFNPCNTLVHQQWPRSFSGLASKPMIVPPRLLIKLKKTLGIRGSSSIGFWLSPNPIGTVVSPSTVIFGAGFSLFVSISILLLILNEQRGFLKRAAKNTDSFAWGDIISKFLICKMQESCNKKSRGARGRVG